MIAGLTEVTKDLGLRFNVVSLLPAAVLALFVFGLVAAGAPGRTPEVELLADRVAGLSTWESAVIFLALIAATLVLEPLQLSFVRALEGYWGGSRIARSLAWPGRTLAVRRRRALASAAKGPAGEASARERAEEMADASRALDRFFPPEDELLPTRLGNVLRAAENRAGGRYGLVTVVVWPRLYPLLPERTAVIVDDLRDRLDLAARFCAAFVAAAAVSFALLVTHGAWLLVPAVALVVAWVAYRGALAAALQYGVGLETAFDLHRFELLRALHVPLPASYAVELAVNKELSAFLLQGPAFGKLAYERGAEEAEPEPAGRLASSGKLAGR